MKTRNHFSNSLRRHHQSRNQKQQFDYQSLETRNLLASVLNSPVAESTAGPTSLVYNVTTFTPVEDRMDLLRTHLNLDPNESLELISLERDQLGFAQFKYQQLYNDIPVENGVYSVHVKNRQIVSLSGDFKNVGHIATETVLSERQAFAEAIAHVNADSYMWEQPAAKESVVELRDNRISLDDTLYEVPVGELTIVKGPADQYVLSYKFDIYAVRPLSRAHIFVDARTGDVVATHDRLRYADVPASGTAIYEGFVEFIADEQVTNHRLRQQTHGVETYDLNGSTILEDAVDFTSVTNTFTDPDIVVGVQAHYSAEQTLTYFADVFGRFGYDNAGSVMQTFAHFGTALNNAFWDGSHLLLGDGDGVFLTPLVALDVVAHEATHAVSDSEVDLLYQWESGALDEGLADIFGEAVQHFATGTADWLAGVQVTTNGLGIRSLSDPKLFELPDTYLGEYWWTSPQDNGGVHTNSSVINKWFYLLSEGGFGTNDTGHSYDIEGLGISDAAQIVYRNMSVYLTPEAQFVDARIGAIQASIDLYGVGSAQHLSTVQSWDAVGVYDPAFEIVLSAENHNPGGSLIYSQSADSAINLGFTYTYVFDLDEGQNLTVAVDGAGGMVPSITVIDPSTNPIATANGGTSNSAVIQSVSINSPGTHLIVVAGHNGTFGEFNIEMLLNADAELEGHSGSANGNLATAQSLEASVLSFENPSGTTTIERLAVVGSLAQDNSTGSSGVSDGFESGILDSAWTSSSSGSGRIEVSDAYTAAGGSYALLMDSTSGYARNEAIWTVDLSQYAFPSLRFYHTEWGDENHPLPNTFSGSFNGDGVAISDDGVTWYTAMTNGATNDGEWSFVEVDLVATANATGLSLGPNFRIKFQQYDNFALPSDGRGYDEIEIFDNVPAADWYSFELAAGQLASLAASKLGEGTLAMDLYDSSGNLVQTSSIGTNVDNYMQQIEGDGSTLYVQMYGDTEYDLVVTRGADFDFEPNGSKLPQDITDVGGVIGHVAGVGLIGADPDDAPVDTVVDFFFPTVTLSNNITGGSVFAIDGTEYGAPTGNHVFARAAERGWYWREGADEFRADFEFLQQSVSIDVGSDDVGDIGYLRAFDQNGIPLAEVISGVVPQGGSETLTISRAVPEIAYITASGLGSEVTPLDNLVFEVDIQDQDYYAIDVSAGESIDLDVVLPGGGPHLFANRLASSAGSTLVVELFDPNGTLLASDPWSISEVAQTVGTYQIVVYATQYLGEYVLLRDIVPGIAEPPGIDFGPVGSNVYEDYAPVSDDAYSQTVGYGWLEESGLRTITLNRGNDLTRDKVTLLNGTFAIDVDNGTYDVDVSLGFVRRRDGMQITVEGQTDLFTPPGSPNVIRSFLVTVTDGQLTIEFDGQPGLNRRIQVAGISLSEVQGRGGNGGGASPVDFSAFIDEAEFLVLGSNRFTGLVTNEPSGQNFQKTQNSHIETSKVGDLSGSLVIDERQADDLLKSARKSTVSEFENPARLEALIEIGEELLKII